LAFSFRNLFAPPSALPVRARPHLLAQTWPAVVYAVGDVHGCLAHLRALEALIVADAAEVAGEKWIVMLGDYVDRGPRSAEVLDHLMARPPAGFQRFCLAGNHEAMMLDFLAAPSAGSPWLTFGGVETLASYGIDAGAVNWNDTNRARAIIDSHIPVEHLDFLRKCPLYLALPGTLMVHAGIRPGIALERQQEADLLWIRQPFLGAELPDGERVVHGHTPAQEPVVTKSRLGIDTGAFATGVLTAARLSPHGHEFLRVSLPV